MSPHHVRDQEAGMGLYERRIQEEFEKERIPKALENFKAEHGAKIDFKIAIDWPSFEGQREAIDNLWQFWEQPLHALADLCKDDLGKKAVAEGVKKVSIKHGEQADVGATFKSGNVAVVFHLQDGGQGTPGWSTIRDVVEAGL
jgi:hypothetical protein